MCDFLCFETPAKPYQKQKFNPAVEWDNTTHHNAVGVNLLYLTTFYFHPIWRLVSHEAHPTAFLFQKLGFARVSVYGNHQQNAILLLLVIRMSN
ncbi:MAG: hypothetical protein IK065_04005 [Neisseriaceae bacterium]|nr:hypothetical protein [Neisseriaceae bacterium]